MFLLFLSFKSFVEMVIPWQFCRTVGPLFSQRLPFARAKAQPVGISESNMTKGHKRQYLIQWILKIPQFFTKAFLTYIFAIHTSENKV